MISLDVAKFDEEMRNIKADKGNIVSIISEIEEETKKMLNAGLTAPEADGLLQSVKTKSDEMSKKVEQITSETENAFNIAKENVVRASATNVHNIPY